MLKKFIVDIKLPGQDRVRIWKLFRKLFLSLSRKRLFEKGIFKEKLLGTYGKKTEELNHINEDPFFKHQMKIVLETACN